jgi:phosphomethylpyrimidine synthase
MHITAKNRLLDRLLRDGIDSLSESEDLALETIVESVDAGTMVLLGNPAHKGVRPTLVGQPAKVKVNANIGTSPLVNDPALEMKKLALAETSGADTVMDLSTGGDLDEIRASMLAASGLPLGTVPVYAAAQRRIARGAHPASFSEQDIFDEISRQAEQGVDFMTVHVGVTRRAAALAKETGRVVGVVSRGGSLTVRWMRENDKENPLLKRFDELLDIALAHNVTLSLGDGMRPGGGCDAGDPAQWEEVVVLAELTKRARDKGVQVMIEGPGHVPLDQVPAQVRTVKTMTFGAPLYVLGPLVTDSAPGYDHIAGAIGGAVGVMHGVDFLCYLTPAEHLTLPGGEDVRAGVMASRIAAHSGEVALGRPRAVERDRLMSEARAALDWNGMAELALDPPVVRHRREEFADKEECGMCGEFCAVKMLKEF